MISKKGRKIFFIHPPESLKNEFLEYIFNNEFELYLLETEEKLEKLLNIFEDSIVFINIDFGMTHIEWTDYVSELRNKYKRIGIAVFTKSKSSSLQRTFLMDIGIKGGFIYLEHDNWKTIELINNVLEANEARGRRKSVRLDFDKNEPRDGIQSKIFTTKGYLFNGKIESVSSAGVLVVLKSGEITEDDNVERIIFSLNNKKLEISGYLLKRFNSGDYFISFEDITEDDKSLVHSYIFHHLQNSFKELLKSL